MQDNYRLIRLMVHIICLFVLLEIPQAMAGSTALSEDSSSAANTQRKGLPLEFELTPSLGYRRDDLDWNIAGDSSGNNPNVLSELTWDDLESVQAKIKGSIVWPNVIALRGSANYGWIFDGKNQDSDFAGNDRTMEFSRSNNNADDGNVLDASVAIGYPFRFGQGVIGTITPLVGYSYHEQNLTITDGNQTISIPVITDSIVIVPPPPGPFPGLDSKYETEWQGPWIGFDMRFKAKEIRALAHRFEPYFSFEYHWADYDAKAEWNLRTDLAQPVSFKHEADGNGIVLGAGFDVVILPDLALNLNLNYQDWETDAGDDIVFFADGTSVTTQLNEVNWTSYAVSLGLTLRF